MEEISFIYRDLWFFQETWNFVLPYIVEAKVNVGPEINFRQAVSIRRKLGRVTVKSTWIVSRVCVVLAAGTSDYSASFVSNRGEKSWEKEAFQCPFLRTMSPPRYTSILFLQVEDRLTSYVSSHSGTRTTIQFIAKYFHIFIFQPYKRYS